MTAIDRVLECAPLRHAVYRNRTPDRGLRHAVSLGCLPFRSFAAVAPWLPPWDIVPPAEACAKVESLYINVKAEQEQESLRLLQEVADIVVTAVEETHTPVPFAKVEHLTVRFVAQANYGRQPRCDLAVQELIQCFPSLQSIKADWTGSPQPDRFWVVPTTRTYHMAGVDVQSPSAAKDTLAAYHRLPKLTSVDGTHHRVGSAFFDSLLLCRGTMKTISWMHPQVISNLVSGPSSPYTWSFENALQLASDAPSPTTTAVKVKDAWISNVGTLVSVHWTLEKLIVACSLLTSQQRQWEVPLGKLMQLVRMCPRLRSVKFDFPAVDDWQTQRVLLASEDVLMSPELNRAPSPKEADVMATAHRYVQAVVAAYDADPRAVPAALLRHRPALDRVVANGSYPAALLWAFSRGPEHTALVTVDLGGALAEDDAAEAAAVVAVAARFRRQRRRSSE